MEEISFELVVFRILKKNPEGLQQKDLITNICKKIKIGRTKTRDQIIKLTYPIVSKKDRTDVYPSLIDNESFNINSSRIFRIYKLNEFWINKDENEYKKFNDDHVNVNYELIIN